MDDKITSIAEFPTSRNKRNIIYYEKPLEIKSKNKILIVPFLNSNIFTPDVRLIEKEMLDFAKEKDIAATEDGCLHIIKTIKKFVYHGFAII